MFTIAYNFPITLFLGNGKRIYRKQLERYI